MQLALAFRTELVKYSQCNPSLLPNSDAWWKMKTTRTMQRVDLGNSSNLLQWVKFVKVPSIHKHSLVTNEQKHQNATVSEKIKTVSSTDLSRYRGRNVHAQYKFRACDLRDISTTLYAAELITHVSGQIPRDNIIRTSRYPLQSRVGLDRATVF